MVAYLEYREWRFPWRRRQHWESVGQIPEADCRYEEDDRSSASKERGPAQGNSKGDGPAAEGGRSSHLGPQLRHVYCRRLPGLLTNSILFGGLFKIKDQCKKVRFQKTHNQGLRQLLLTVLLGPPCLAHHTWRCPCISVVPEATHKTSRGPEKGAVSAPKALWWSETETRESLGGMQEFRKGFIDLPLLFSPP